MSDLKPGDICIAQNLRNAPEFNGEECTVLRVEFCKTHHAKTNEYLGIGFFYIVEWADGETSAQVRHELRKKPNPGEDTVEQIWNDLIQRLTEGVPA